MSKEIVIVEDDLSIGGGLERAIELVAGLLSLEVNIVWAKTYESAKESIFNLRGKEALVICDGKLNSKEGDGVDLVAELNHLRYDDSEYREITVAGNSSTPGFFDSVGVDFDLAKNLELDRLEELLATVFFGVSGLE